MHQLGYIPISDSVIAWHYFKFAGQILQRHSWLDSLLCLKQKNTCRWIPRLEHWKWGVLRANPNLPLIVILVEARIEGDGEQYQEAPVRSHGQLFNQQGQNILAYSSEVLWKHWNQDPVWHCSEAVSSCNPIAKLAGFSKGGYIWSADSPRKSLDNSIC